jgi:hypothetical protein
MTHNAPASAPWYARTSALLATPRVIRCHPAAAIYHFRKSSTNRSCCGGQNERLDSEAPGDQSRAVCLLVQGAGMQGTGSLPMMLLLLYLLGR